MKPVFDLSWRGFRVSAYWGSGSDAFITLYQGGCEVAEFMYPAYKIFNVAAHFDDLIDEFLSTRGW